MDKMNKNLIKSEKGSITLFVLISCLFFLAVAVSVSVFLTNKGTAIDSEYKQIKESYGENVGNEADVYKKININNES